MEESTRILLGLSDEELMLQYKLGNSDAFNLLYERHATKVYGYLVKKLYSKSQAQDVFQDTFLKLHKFRNRYDASFPFLPWLFTVCRNSMVDYLRRVGRDRELEAEVGSSVNSDLSMPQPDQSPQLERLTAKEGAVVELHYLQGYSFEEVATHLKIKPSNARKISSRAIQKLRVFWK